MAYLCFPRCCLARLLIRGIDLFMTILRPNSKSPEPTAVSAGRSAVAVQAASRHGGSALYVRAHLHESLPLTFAEEQLVRWMLEHGKPEARAFLPQLERAQVTDWRCSCGCASINFLVEGFAEPSGGLHPLADFIFGTDDELSGIFVFEQSGVLAGLEVYGLAGDAPKTLPSSDSLKPFENRQAPCA